MQRAIPKSVIILFALSMGICFPIIALSVVNYGTLSIWLNSTVASLILIHHFVFFFVSFVAKKRSPRPKIVIDEDDPKTVLPLEEEEPSTFIHIVNVFSLTFLFVLNAIAFVIMVDITRLGGVKSTLPTERIGSHKWNIKIEIGQTSILGVELLVLSAILAMCISGRRRFSAEQKEKMDEMDYGLI
ncbi:hypothetical protein CPB84DRAFT_1712792 [Gymnopilus junonius]|uniref:Uncharacterized protein n=1 Tax=Gymnopilus junonius TaxID=109634 RepID=A0A9P5NFS3_GYMJU|nr:hypothetical protein CPB84DRAFT_1712792 [Gymnopilus junonius]